MYATREGQKGVWGKQLPSTLPGAPPALVPAIAKVLGKSSVEYDANASEKDPYRYSGSKRGSPKADPSL